MSGFSSQFSNQQKIETDKIIVAHENTPATLLGNLLGCLPLAIVLWNEHYTLAGGGWVAALYCLTICRWLHYRTLNPATASYQQITQFAKVQTFLVFIAGWVWGSAGVIFFDPNDIKPVAFIILTFVCMVAASLASLSSRPLTFSAFAIPIMTPLIVNLFAQVQPFYIWMAFGATVYLLATFTFSLNLARVIHNSLKLKYENLDLIVDLQEQTEKANTANREKSRFLAATSHDLRQPLHAVNLYYEVLNQKLSDPEQRKELDNIHRGLHSLNSLLDILFDISRLDAGIVEKNKTTFNLEDIICKLSQQFEIDARNKGIDFTAQRQPYFIYSDPALLERVLTNLLVNAVRYTYEGQVQVFMRICDKKTLAIHVKDSGIGIPLENRNEIFSEFFQLHNPERDRQKGLGLGLAIVKRVLELLDHRITLNSVLGQGSEFIVEVPLGKQSDSAELAAGVPDVTHKLSLSGTCILLIENEADIINAMQALLTQWGCRSIVATSAEQALDLIKAEEKPELILSDYRMPGLMNGCQIIKEIQALIGNIPAIVITGDTGESVSAEIKQNSLVSLHKPIKPAQLRILMARLLH